MTLSAGTKLGPYEIVAPIGAGGFGEVYKARDTRLNRTVAIKVLSHDLSTRPEARQRFEREAKAIAALNHPHICTLYDVGEHQGADYLVMEFLEGETLAKRLERGPLPLDQALKRAVEISDALDKAHAEGVVHRDLKPANIMLTASGGKLLDFGLAKLREDLRRPSASSLSDAATKVDVTAEGSILGTLQYMAPEQLDGQEADARSDIWSLGLIIYEMVAGKKAFTGKSQARLISAILSAPFEPIASLKPHAPAPLDHLVDRCLAKDPKNRWQSVHDITLQLDWLISSRPLEAPRARRLQSVNA